MFEELELYLSEATSSDASGQANSSTPSNSSLNVTSSADLMLFSEQTEPPKDYSDYPRLSLNYSAKYNNRFIYDSQIEEYNDSHLGSLTKDIVDQYVTLKNKNESGLSLAEEQFIFNFNKNISRVQYYFKYNQNELDGGTNIGIRQEDLISLVVVKTQEFADQLRALIDPTGREDFDVQTVHMSDYEDRYQKE